jgi:hypothetical protein
MQTFQLTLNRVRHNELRFTPDGATLAIGGLPYVLLDLTAGAQRNLHKLGLGSWGWALVRNGAAVAHLPSSTEVQIYDIETERVSRHTVENGSARGIAIDRSGGLLYLSVGAPGLRPESEIRVATADMAPRGAFGAVGDYLGKLVLSADEGTIAASCGNWNAALRGDNFSFRVWNIANENRPSRARAQIRPRDPVNSFALSADGSRLAVAESSALSLWDTTSGKQVVRSGKHRRGVLAVACNPTKPLLVTGDTAGNVFLWDHAGNVMTRYDWKLREVHGLCFAPDGLRCAAVDAQGKVVIWDVDV